MSEASPLKQMVAPDGSLKLEIIQIGSTLYRYVCYRRMLAAPEDEGAIGEGYWAVDQSSGLYDDPARCERDALTQAPWLSGRGDAPRTDTER